MKIWGWVLSALFCLVSAANADEFALFEQPGVHVRDYNTVIGRLGSNDRVRFSNGKSFTIQQFLDEGGTTRIYDIGDNKVIRIPRMDANHPYAKVPYRWFIRSYFQGYNALKEAGVPLVNVFTSESDAEEYVVVSKEKVHFTYDDLFRRRVSLSPEKEQKVWADLIEFGARTWPFREIGDWRPNQLAYTERGWVLLDWSSDHVYAQYVEDEMLYFWGPLEVRRAIEKRIRELRKAQLVSRSQLLEECGRRFSSDYAFDTVVD